jgi:alpha-glucosidase
MAKIQRWDQALGPDAWPNYVFNNHDVVRTATRWVPRFSRNSEDDARLKLAAALLLTLRGTPFIYYGEEIGMRNIPIRSYGDVLDPVGRTFWPFMKGRDGCRAPMQWSAAENAGFSVAGARTWLPLHADYPRRNVQTQRGDPHSLLQAYRRLIEIRRATPALTTGMFLPLTYGTRYILAYLRQTSDQTVLVAMNISRRRQRLVLGSHLARQDWTLLFSTHRDSLPPVRKSLLPLEPFEAMILRS